MFKLKKYFRIIVIVTFFLLIVALQDISFSFFKKINNYLIKKRRFINKM